MIADRLTRVQIQKKIDAWGEEIYNTATDIGQQAQKAFGDDEANSQIRGLGSVANSARKVTDVYDFIKNQTGKSREGKRWRAPGADKMVFGTILLKQLEGFEEQSEEILRSLKIDVEANVTLKRHVHIELIRTFLRYMTSHYLYRRSMA